MIRNSIEADGREYPIASLMKRCVALAVDLSVMIMCCSLGMLAVSRFVPLDRPAAGGAILLIVGAAAFYMVIARDRYLPSLGRTVFGLTIVKMAGPLPAFFDRTITVHIDENTKSRAGDSLKAVLIATLASCVAAVSLVLSLTTTDILGAAKLYTTRSAEWGQTFGHDASLATLPQALVIGKRRGFLRIGVERSANMQAAAFYLQRVGNGRWQVESVVPAHSSWEAQYSLKVADKDVPRKQ